MNVCMCVLFLIVSPCEVHPCKNGGICSNEKDGGFKCACRNGYGGQLCNQKGIPFHFYYKPITPIFHCSQSVFVFYSRPLEHNKTS